MGIGKGQDTVKLVQAGIQRASATGQCADRLAWLLAPARRNLRTSFRLCQNDQKSGHRPHLALYARR